MPKTRSLQVTLTGEEVRKAAIRHLLDFMEDEIPAEWVVQRAVWRTGHDLDITIGPEDEA